MLIDQSADILGLWGEHRYLSNFWGSRFKWNDTWWPTVEHAYQYSKTTDEGYRRDILAAPTPGDARRLGQQCPKVPDWNARKVEVMRSLVWCKFMQNDDLRAKLLSTHGKIVETNTWGDVFWGVCEGVGQNMLGRILMSTRTTMRSFEL